MCLIAASLGVPQSASAADCAGLCVIVNVVNGTQLMASRTYSADQLSNSEFTDVIDKQYLTRSTKNTTPQSEPFVGVGASIDSLAGGAGAEPGKITYVDVDITGAKNPTNLSGDDFAPAGSVGSPFADGLVPVFFAPGDNTLEYIRPLRPGADDVNNRDIRFSTTSLTVTVHLTGMLLAPVVTAPAGTTTIDAGQTVNFDAMSDGSALTWTWTFDGSTGSGLLSAPETTHRFANAGRYNVFVDVDGADGSSGRSASVQIIVDDNGTAPPKPTDPGTGGSHNGGGGKHNPIGGPNVGSGHAVGGAPTSNPASISATSSPASPESEPASASASAVVPQPGGGTDSAAAAPKAGGAQASGRSGSGTASGTSVAGDRVVGYVLAGGLSGPVPGTPVTSQVPPALAARGRGTTGHFAMLVLGVLAVFVLLTLGAGTELRRPYRRPRRRAR